MASFQSVVVIVAIVLLIIILIIVGLTLVKGKSNVVWPPVIGDCPDYWLDISGNGTACTANAQKTNMGIAQSPMNFSGSSFVGTGTGPTSGACAKYTWAMNNKVSWDGLTYGVPNPCTVVPAKTTTLK